MSPSPAARSDAALVIALLALVVALGGTSYAAVTLAKNSVGAKQLKANAVTAAKVKDGSLSRNDFGTGQLPAGPTGATGPAGVAGVPGTARGWASVSASGAVVDSGGLAPTVTRVAAGVYHLSGPGWGGIGDPVAFGVNLSGGAGMVAGNRSGVEPNGGGFTVFPSRVRTFTKDGDPGDQPFFVFLP